MDKLEMLYEKLSCSAIEYYLEQDKNFIKNIEWMIEFLLAHHVLPQQECFPYSGEQVMDWYKNLNETNEIYEAIKQAAFEIMITPKTKLVWYRKWHAFQEYVDGHYCIPLRGKAKFYDGKDMSSWFSTQKYCLHHPDKTNCNSFTLFQKKLVQSLIDAEHMIKHPYVSHKDLLNQLYKAILHNDMKEIYSLQVKLNYGKI